MKIPNRKEKRGWFRYLGDQRHPYVRRPKVPKYLRDKPTIRGSYIPWKERERITHEDPLVHASSGVYNYDDEELPLPPIPESDDEELPDFDNEEGSTPPDFNEEVVHPSEVGADPRTGTVKGLLEKLRKLEKREAALEKALKKKKGESRQHFIERVVQQKEKLRRKEGLGPVRDINSFRYSGRGNTYNQDLRFDTKTKRRTHLDNTNPQAYGPHVYTIPIDEEFNFDNDLFDYRNGLFPQSNEPLQGFTMTRTNSLIPASNEPLEDFILEERSFPKPIDPTPTYQTPSNQEDSRRVRTGGTSSRTHTTPQLQGGDVEQSFVSDRTSTGGKTYRRISRLLPQETPLISQKPKAFGSRPTPKSAPIMRKQVWTPKSVISIPKSTTEELEEKVEELQDWDGVDINPDLQNLYHEIIHDPRLSLSGSFHSNKPMGSKEFQESLMHISPVRHNQQSSSRSSIHSDDFLTASELFKKHPEHVSYLHPEGRGGGKTARKQLRINRPDSEAQPKNSQTENTELKKKRKTGGGRKKGSKNRPKEVIQREKEQKQIKAAERKKLREKKQVETL